MPYEIDETHDPSLESWVESANDPETDFPIQNLPLVELDVPMWTRPDCEDMREELGENADRVRSGALCVRIGEVFLDLDWCEHLGVFDNTGIDPSDALYRPDDDDEDPCGAHVFRGVVQRALSVTHPKAEQFRRMPQLLIGPDDNQVSHPFLPGGITDYTDFYASVFHATNVGSMFRPGNALLPNYKHVPIGYHGRASTIVPSGTDVVRPVGQQAPAEEGGMPGFGPCKLLDYELEVGVVVGRGNELGTTIPIDRAEDHILGLCLVNDWSARDLQKWEYQPLGPFLAKSFATTVSPYIVTMEALAPFRTPAYERPAGDPSPLPYLTSDHDRAHGGVDLTLEVFIASEQMRQRSMAPMRISKGSFKDMYWTIAQMLTHHASNGCAMQPGDLLASGTVSGKTRDSRGCLLELTWDGDAFADPPVLVPGTQRTPITLPTGEERKFLADGDEVILKGSCERDGFRRIGFGECRGIVRPAPSV